MNLGLTVEPDWNLPRKGVLVLNNVPSYLVMEELTVGNIKKYICMLLARPLFSTFRSECFIYLKERTEAVSSKEWEYKYI